MQEESAPADVFKKNRVIDMSKKSYAGRQQCTGKVHEKPSVDPATSLKTLHSKHAQPSVLNRFSTHLSVHRQPVFATRNNSQCFKPVAAHTKDGLVKASPAHRSALQNLTYDSIKQARPDISEAGTAAHDNTALMTETQSHFRSRSNMINHTTTEETKASRHQADGLQNFVQQQNSMFSRFREVANQSKEGTGGLKKTGNAPNNHNNAYTSVSTMGQTTEGPRTGGALSKLTNFRAQESTQSSVAETVTIRKAV